MMTSDLKAMFWKECRENARWAVLALLGLSLGLAYAWFHLFQQSSFSNLGQIWSSENLVLTITTPLIGLALGLLQILPELRRDQWAFLVHRPASRTTLFWGKVIPGVCLYLAATILPLLGLAVWAAQPSHVPAPFDFRFTLAGWAAILAGLPFYFAGLLVALRPARWYGSRALPLLGALLAIWASDNLNEFWQVALICLLIAAVLLLAAWGSFVTGGEYGEQTKPARFALGLALYPAMIAVGLGVLIGAFAILNGLSGRHGDWSQQDDKIDTQGRLFHYFEYGKDAAHMDRATVTVTDTNGHPVNPRVWDNLNQQHKFLNLNYLPIGNLSQADYRYSNPSRYVIDLDSTLSDSNQTYWYYEVGAHQIVGYSVSAGIPAPPIYLGPNGSARNREGAGQFAGPRPETTSFGGLRLLRFPQALYWYDTTTPIVGLLQATPGGSSSMALLDQTNISQPNNNEARALVIAAEGQITVYIRTPPGPPPAVAKLFTIPMAMPLDPKTDSDIQVAMTPDRSRFYFWYGRWSRSVPGRLVTVASDGRILKNETLPPPKTTGAPIKLPFVQAAPALILPLDVLAALWLYASIGHTLGWSSAAGFWNSLPGVGPILFFSALGGLFAAVLAWLVSRRLGDSQRGRIAWAFGVFWLGGYGILLLLALRAWPARVPCPNCGRLRVVDRETCEHCGAAFARPPRDGTEIFDGEREAMAR